ncbi:hypothetical protein LQZ19_07175 [Treponema primitia]|uniref:hypothetical protein n=1 Tax=Treponema primitia TaxID=88058 RepID=UPI00397F7E15
MNPTDKPSGETAILSDKSSFKEVVNEACNRLWDRRVQYSIRRIREMEDALKTLELELDLMIKDSEF